MEQHLPPSELYKFEAEVCADQFTQRKGVNYTTTSYGQY